MDELDGAAKPDPRKLTVVDEAASVWQPGLREHVEAFVQTELGVCFEFGGTLLGGDACVTSLACDATLCSLGCTASTIALMDVSNDGGEIAIAEPHLTAARVTTKAAFGVVEIFERVAAKGMYEGFA